MTVKNASGVSYKVLFALFQPPSTRLAFSKPNICEILHIFTFLKYIYSVFNLLTL